MSRFYQFTYVDLPAAVAKRWMGGSDLTLAGTGWTAYDSFLSLANELTDASYANPVVALTFGRALETPFNVQYVLDALDPSGPIVAAPGPVTSETPDIARHEPFATPEMKQADVAPQYRTAVRARRPGRSAA